LRLDALHPRVRAEVEDPMRVTRARAATPERTPRISLPRGWIRPR
jgi:hypothetical protein